MSSVDRPCKPAAWVSQRKERGASSVSSVDQSCKPAALGLDPAGSAPRLVIGAPSHEGTKARKLGKLRRAW